MMRIMPTMTGDGAGGPRRRGAGCHVPSASAEMPDPRRRSGGRSHAAGWSASPGPILTPPEAVGASPRTALGVAPSTMLRMVPLPRRMRRGRIAGPHPLASASRPLPRAEEALSPHLRHELGVEIALDRLGAALAAVARILHAAEGHLR